MPNTLAHMGIQALITRRLIPGADLGWIWLGVLLPDLPWILQRIALKLPVEISQIDLRLYAIVQSTFVCSAIAAAGFAVLARRPWRVMAILTLGCFLHLMLDATQTKWANGVLLFAPANWSLLNFGLYWPENWPSHVLGATGLSYVIWAALWIRPCQSHASPLSGGRPKTAIALFALYALCPFAVMPQAEAADVHYAGTLRDIETRPDRPIGFDRASVLRKSDGVAQLRVWTGEMLNLTGRPIPESARTVSIQGRFTDAATVEVTRLHVHAAGRRDAATLIGLVLVAVWWGWILMKRRQAPSL